MITPAITPKQLGIAPVTPLSTVINGTCSQHGRLSHPHAMNTSLTVARRAALRARAAAPRIRCYATPSAPAPTSPAPMTSTLPEDDDPQLGDYPRLPFVSKQTRPARGWEDPQFRRNFGEPVRLSILVW